VSDASSYHVGQLSGDGRWRWDGTAWKPVSNPLALPRWINLKLRSRATWVTVAGAVLVGLLTDQAFRAGTFGLAASITASAGALMLATVGGVKRLESRLMLAAAAVFAVWFTLRASPWLLWPDLLIGVALLGLAASLGGRGSLFDLGIAELLARAVHASIHMSAGAAFVARPIVAARDRYRNVTPLARGLLIAAPIAAVLGGLLASADPVFASFFTLNIDAGQLVVDGLFIAFGLLVMAGLFRLAASEPVGRIDGPAWRLGAAEALTVLVVLDAVFAAFALAQVLAATGAADASLRSAGVTYSEYARSGFFQLLWVSGITLAVLVLFSRITGLSQRASKVTFTVLAETAIALTLMVVAVAFNRLSLYEQAYGFSMLRLYSHIFAVWVGVVYVLLALDLLGVMPQRRWFVGAVGATAMTMLLALNVINPEALVVTLNVDHAKSAHKIDASYLQELSSDATPALLGSRAALDPALREQVNKVACTGSPHYSASLAAFNWAEAQAAAARRANC
jgi:hypothetical protein